MQIALIGDLEKVGKLVNIISNNWDNAQVSLFPSVTDFQCKAIMRTIYADRLILLDNTTVGGQDALFNKMSSFSQFLEEDTTYGVTTIVVLCKNLQIADIYARFFNDARSLVLTFTSTLKSIDVRNFAGESLDELRKLYKDSIAGSAVIPEKKVEAVEKKGLFGAKAKSSNYDSGAEFAAMDATSNGATFADDLTQTDFISQGFYPQYNTTGVFANTANVTKEDVSAMQVLDTIFDAPEQSNVSTFDTTFDNNDDLDEVQDNTTVVDDSDAFTEISFDNLFADTSEEKNEDTADLNYAKESDVKLADIAETEESEEFSGDSESTFDVKNSVLLEGVEQRINAMSEDEMAALFDD